MKRQEKAGPNCLRWKKEFLFWVASADAERGPVFGEAASEAESPTKPVEEAYEATLIGLYLVEWCSLDRLLRYFSDRGFGCECQWRTWRSAVDSFVGFPALESKPRLFTVLCNASLQAFGRCWLVSPQKVLLNRTQGDRVSSRIDCFFEAFSRCWR